MFNLRDRLDEIPADVRIAVLDACASGAFTRIKGGKSRPPFLVNQSANMRGHAFLTSSAATEAAHESDRIKASYFTHYLVSGFRGAADMSGDGQVTLNEAYQFAFTETVGRTVDTQGRRAASLVRHQPVGRRRCRDDRRAADDRDARARRESRRPLLHPHRPIESQR